MNRLRASTDTTKRRAAKYREAARKIAEGEQEGVVFALGKRLRNPPSEALRHLFAEQGFWLWTFETDRRAIRVLALCFMAAMVEAGDA